MLARATTFLPMGLTAQRVTVKVDARRGLPALTILGATAAEVEQTRARLRRLLGAERWQPLAEPRIEVHVAPAHARDQLTALDLPIACALLAATGQIDPQALSRWPLIGDLWETGRVSCGRGVLVAAEAARRAGYGQIIVGQPTASEATLVDGLDVVAVSSLREIIDTIARGAGPAPEIPTTAPRDGHGPDLADVRGHQDAIEAMVIAAAGGHHLHLYGEHGSGKTMLARRLVTILPPLTREEAREVERIQSAAGRLDLTRPPERPLRAPHPAIGLAGLLGDGPWIEPGELALAHHGILLLEDLAGFSTTVLKAVHGALRAGATLAHYNGYTVRWPASVLMAATSRTAGHVAPIAGLLDIRQQIQRPRADELASPPTTTSADARERVMAARERQAYRLAGSTARLNAQMSDRETIAHCQLTVESERALSTSRQITSDSERLRVMRLARTIADLADRNQVVAYDIEHALQLRSTPATAAPRIGA